MIAFLWHTNVKSILTMYTQHDTKLWQVQQGCVSNLRVTRSGFYSKFRTQTGQTLEKS